ncbi:hypothetical protein ACNHKD_11775 [Methylocystis sp. JAN1]|uniref:hypothetical protein n=1 Tax=Methylocystis sp. JAN1 TaxID=3397211 RepID=UPI003FA1ABC8
MEFRALAEVFDLAYPALDKVRDLVEPQLNAAFATSALSSVEGKLRYVPIVMPEGMRERYPARSKLRKKQQVYDCAPQLNYETFVDGTFEQQVREYIRGVAESAPHLSGLGASPEQIAEFEKILTDVADRIIANELDKTRH